MTEPTFRRTLFAALFLAAPAVVFLVQVIFFVPPVVILAGLVVTAGKFAQHGFRKENLVFLAFFLVHLLVFAGLYYLLSWLCARLTRLLPDGWPRRGLLALLLGGLLLVTQLPIYGGGGHGPSRMGPLQHVLVEIWRSFGLRL